MAYVLVKADDKDEAATRNIANIAQDPRKKKRPVQIERTGEGKSDTVGLPELGLTPPTKNINPASMPAPSLTNEQRQAINELVASEGFGDLTIAEQRAKLDEIRGVSEPEPEPEDSGDASKFMAGTDRRTDEGRNAAMVQRVMDNPGLMDRIMDEHDIDPDLLRAKHKGDVGAMLRDIREGSAPTLSTGEEVDRETGEDQARRLRAIQQIGEGADPEEVGVKRSKRGADIGRTFAPMGGTEELSPEELVAVKQRLGSSKLGERDKALDDMGLTQKPDGSIVRVMRPRTQERNPETGRMETVGEDIRSVPEEFTDAQLAEMATRGVGVRENELDKLNRQKQELEDRLSGREIVPAATSVGASGLSRDKLLANMRAKLLTAERTGNQERASELQRQMHQLETKPDDEKGEVYDPADVEGIRVGAQDQLQGIADKKTQTAKDNRPENLQSVSAFLASQGIRKPLHPADRGVNLTQLNRPVSSGGKRGKVTAENLAQYEKENAAYKAALANAPEELERARAEQDKEFYADATDESKDEEIQERIPEYLKEKGVAVQPPVPREFATRRDRDENITRDPGQAQSLRALARSQLSDDGDHNEHLQRKAHELGLDLTQDPDVVEAFAKLGIDTNHPDFPSPQRIERGGPLHMPQQGGSYGKRVQRRLKTQSTDQPVGTENTANVHPEKLKEAQNVTQRAIANHLHDTLSSMPIEEANTHLPSSMQMIDNLISGDERANIMSDIDRVNSQIKEHTEKVEFADDQKSLTDPKFIDAAVEHHEKRLQQKDDDLTERSINQAAMYFANTHPQAVALKNAGRIEEAKNFAEEEVVRQRQKLERSLNSMLGIMDNSSENIQIPSQMANELPQTATMVMGGRKGDDPDKATPIQDIGRLEAQLSAAENRGDEEAASRIKRQIGDMEGRQTIDAARGGNPDYDKEQYTRTVASPTNDLKNITETKERKATHDLGTHTAGLTHQEKIEFGLGALMDNHNEALKTGDTSWVDEEGTSEKDLAELLYRKQGRQATENVLDNDGNIVTRHKPNVFEQQTTRNRAESDDIDRTAAEAGLHPASQVPPDTGLGNIPMGRDAEARPDELSANEKRLAAQGQARAEDEHIERTVDEESLVDRMRRKDIRDKQTNAAKQMMETLERLQEKGIDMEQLKTPTMRGEEPAPAAPMPAPAPPPPAAAPMGEEGQEGAPNPFEGAQVLPEQPPQSSTQFTPQPMTELTAEQIQQINEMTADPDFLALPPEQQQAILAQVKKSTPIKRFNATKGDELLKGIKDKFWRQGY